MKKLIIFIIFALALTACSRGGPTPTEQVSVQQPTRQATTPTPTKTATPIPPTETATPTVSPTPTPEYPKDGYGPQNFPDKVNPLTGEIMSSANTLAKRPLAIKVNIVPRTSTRPPWGLSRADIVFDYYQNNGYTRFHTIFYGQDTELAGPIRSARFPDHSLIRMYKSIFAYGSADPIINQRLFNSEYYDRLVLEGGGDQLCPPSDQDPMCRFDPQGYSILLGGTKEIHTYVKDQGVDDSRQNLDGMYFNLEPPDDGQDGELVTVRYSNDDFAQWEYDPSIGEYLRNQDDAFDAGQGEEYAPLVDRNNDEQIAADNVVVLLMEHSFYRQPPNEIIEILMLGSGTAYAFRDGEVYEVRWSIPAQDSVLYLTYEDGTPFPYKPGNTWYQVIGVSSNITTPESGSWRFEFITP